MASFRIDDGGDTAAIDRPDRLVEEPELLPHDAAPSA